MNPRWTAIIVVGSLILGSAGAAFAVSTLDPLASAAITAIRGGDASEAWAEGGDRPQVLEDPEFGTVEAYAVDLKGNLDPAPIPGTIAEQAWLTFERVATKRFAGQVVAWYYVGDDPRSDTLAYVYREDPPQYWSLTINQSTSEVLDVLVPTLVHEYAHMLTLSEDEVIPDRTPCHTISLPEGCVDEGSVLWAFHDRFWADYEDAPTPRNDSWERTTEFYLAHEEDFVSEYAAWSVVEDIAESFMTYVMEDAPTGDSVAADKLRFFADYPEFVEIRDRIRLEFADDLGLVP